MSENYSKGRSTFTKLEEKLARKKRVRALLDETFTLSEDPYFNRNGIGKIECKLCYTVHNTEYGYITHRQGKKHQSNCTKKFKTDIKDKNTKLPEYEIFPLKKGYNIKLKYKDINYKPIVKIITAIEQNVENVDYNYKYIVIHANEYKRVGFKIRNEEISEFIEYFDEITRILTIQFIYK